jgi:N-methylhydantoinase A
MRRLRVAIDIGGTFTDLVAYDEDSEQLLVAKTPSTPPLFIDGVLTALEKAGIGPGEITYLKHGSTIATNAIIERTGAKAGLLTTRGMRDVLAAGRANRPDLFNSNWDPSPPLIQRRNVLEATERVDYVGSVMTTLEEEDVREAARKFGARGIESVAVSYLNSFMNPEHELRTREILEEELGDGVFVCTSAETLPEIREFERTSTVAANAYLAPVIDRYLDALVTRLRAWGYEGEFAVTHSGGGMMSVQLARSVPARICQSGPAGGVIGGLVVGKASGFDNVITFDMGGTSTDISLVADGKPSIASEWRVDWNIPILFPAVDLVAIGAGGGTIAWIDGGGSLRSGPESAGADPGPACFGKGNEQPTTTDAHLYLGRLDPEQFLGGDMTIYPELAEQAIERLATELGMSPAEAASGILRIAEANMTSATHLISVQRGHDPRDFTLVAGGGAGPLHAVEVARELGIPRVVVPLSPGLTSALGILHVDLRHDLQRSVLRRSTELSPGDLVAVFDELVAEAKRVLEAERIPEDKRVIELSLDVRYYGQTPYMNLPVTAPPATGDAVEALLQRYEEDYLREFGYVLPRDFATIEFVNARVAAIGLTQEAKLPRSTKGGKLADASLGARPVYFEDAGDFVDTALYDRARLANGMEFAGPAVVEQIDSTLVLPPGAHARVDEYLNIVVTVNGG